MAESADPPSGLQTLSSPLSEKRCSPCTGKTPALDGSAALALLRELDGWELDESGHLSRSWKTTDFRHALELVNRISEIAESENHHPEIRFGWGHVEVELWTHAIGGLSENDFILAARIDQVSGGPRAGV